MGRKNFKYGDLNPANHPQDGRTLDPESFTGAGNLTEAARRVNTPNFIEKLGFPLKGIVIRVETNHKGKPEASSNSNEGWGAWSYSSTLPQPQLWRCRVRIPELHAHLPIPFDFGPEGLNSIMALYPVFQSKDEATAPPIVGEICYVDFGDRERFEDPIFLGMVKSGGTPVEGGTSSENSNPVPSLVINENPGPLSVQAPPGDSIGSSFEIEPELDAQSQVPVVVPPKETFKCTDTKNPSNNPPSCGPLVSTSPGEYETAERGRSTGKKEMATWNNRSRKDVLVLAASKHTLELMEAAFIKDTGIKDIDIKRFIVSGFRNLEHQECQRKKYEECLKEWKRKGGKRPTRNPPDKGALLDEQPSAVAKSGFSKHNSGLAVDFDHDGKGKGKKSRSTALWIWLQKNSRKFGWVNPAWARNNPAEPWHFEFNESLAKKNGMLPQ